VTSFAFPGKLGFVDKYQVSIQKMIIHQLDKTNPLPLFNREQTESPSASAIQFADLIPYLTDVQPGTLFFSVQGRRVSKIFIRNEWKHCGIFLGTLQQIEHYWGKEHDLVNRLRAFYTAEDEYLIFDSSYDQGVSVRSISELADLNNVSTLRELLLFEFTYNKEAWSQSIQNNLSNVGKEYDYCFVLNSDDALYCAELLHKVMPLEKNYFTPSAKIAGRPLLLPSDLVDAILEKGIGSGAFKFKAYISKKEGTMPVQPL
jgi:hypothetical protein